MKPCDRCKCVSCVAIIKENIRTSQDLLKLSTEMKGLKERLKKLEKALKRVPTWSDI